MPTLNWIGKDAVVAHHKQVPFRLLKPIDKLSVGDDSGNLLVQGDNLEALKALLPYYAGQVKCIYIDPPYNTGNENWVYNDNVNSPEMKEWLGKVVGGESEDLSRHDKWLSMIYPRLVLLRELLRDDGAIFISIDDVEVGILRPILDEIFGKQNFIATIVWQKKQSPQNDAINLSDMHDYIVVYAKRAKQSRNDALGWQRHLLSRGERQSSRYTNPDNDSRGDWTSSDSTCNKTADERPNLYYAVINPLTSEEIWPSRRRVWLYEKAVFNRMILEKRVWWGEKGKNFPRVKKFLSEVAEGIVPSTWWGRDFAGDNQEAQREIRKIFAIEEQGFSTPKPTQLIQRILQISTNADDLILDSFAGSGTTGHAVLQMNKEDDGNRRFILVEMDTNISQNITAERLKRVVNGYTYKDQKGNKKKEEGLGGGFRYCELGVTLFDADGQIREEVKYNDLAQHVYFIETGQPLTLPSPFGRGKNHFPLLGVHNGTAVYLLYNGILKDKKANGGNVLTRAMLQSLPKHEGPKIIYGNGCLLSEERLRELDITFKQIPYEVKAS
jgi:adenine-specific DNA-methyltransferase